ncbi:MAG: HlyD family efflux transporter periplasmic adaptor subunit [Cytophagales bacterium]|nr:MAG: HlyD family efflux transporter periplasmic adaptor subunit [Cytophagales bacterium]
MEQQQNHWTNEIVGGRRSGPVVVPTIELRSPDVNEVLGQPPAWLVRWGISLVFLVLLVLLGIAWFIHYPDRVSAPLRVLAVSPPRPVVTRTEGKLERLFVVDDQPVRAGQVLAWLESTADHAEVLALDRVADTLVQRANGNRLERVQTVSIPLFFRLGEVQRSYQTFQEAFVRAKASLANGLNSQKGQVLTNDVGQLQSLYENGQAQLDNLEADLQLAAEELDSQERLSKRGLVSRNEYRQALSRYLSRKQAYEQARSSLNSNRLSQNGKRQEQLELQRTVTDGRVSLVQAINTLKSDLEAWKQRYVAVAPVAGRFSMATTLQEGQYLKTGQELGHVLPPDGRYYGEMLVGQYNFGKVRVGQRVLVQLPSYPHEQFGSVEGEVKAIGAMPRDTAFRIQVVFPNGLMTTAHHPIPYRTGLVASGQIITEDTRLLERLFHEFLRVVRQ